jgi:hypothetical protein
MRITSRLLSSFALALPLLGVTLVRPVAAQTTDAGTLQLRTGGRDIGTETFTLTITGSGITFSTRAAYAGRRPAPEFTANLERQGGEDFAFQLEARGGNGGGQTFAVQKRNRLTVRRVARGADQATELPGGPAVIILADSVFLPYLQAVALATEAGRPLTAVMLPDARRVSFSAQRSVTSGGTLVRLSGGLDAEIELGSHGEVLRISLPGSGQEAVRSRN